MKLLKWQIWIIPAVLYILTTLYIHSSIHSPSKLPIERPRIIQRRRRPPSQGWTKPSSSYIIDPNDLWENSKTMPLWMKDYFRWHKEVRSQLDETNYQNQRYLLVTCLKESPKCGGTADRLMSLPFMIRIAAKTQRFLTIKWGRPAQLEEFLMPPKYGFDWRTPQWLFRIVKRKGKKAFTQEDILEFTVDTSITASVVKTRFQSHDHGADYYNEHRESSELSFEAVYHDFWRTMFTPSPPVANEILEIMKKEKLTPNTYGAAHLRANYVVDATKEMAENWARNAITCTTQLLQQPGPVFFASDSDLANRAADSMSREFRQLNIVTRRSSNPPLHLDKTPDWRSRDPKEFFDTFIDLLIMGHARCVTYSVGNFGKLASLISNNFTCSSQHLSGAGNKQCELYDGTRAESVESDFHFLPPMDDLVEPSDTIRTGTGLSSYLPVNDTEARYPFLANIGKERIWQRSRKLPGWAKDYFEWHSEARRRLDADPNSYVDYRFLILVCPKSDKICGGTADRLQPVPFLVRIASMSRRVLLIRWERPCALENFLVPPSGGMDWRVPDFLLSYITKRVVTSSNTVHKVVDDAQTNRTVVRTRLQAHDHGSNWYNQQAIASGEPEDAFRQHFRDMWYTLFTPVRPLATQIQTTLNEKGLQVGKYSFAHLRANYAIERRGRDRDLTRNWTIDALNCLSNIQPGPYYFASDNEYAKRVAVDYGREMGTKVVALTSVRPILHLDQADNDGVEYRAEDFYAVWIDLYLMALSSGCMSYNVGGFGKLGRLMSGRHTCNIRYWTKGVAKATADINGCKRRDQSQLQDMQDRNSEKYSVPFLTPM